MKTIWKFSIEIDDRQTVEMPRDAEILTAQFQGGHLCLWALVDANEMPDKRTIEVFGTGNPVRVDMGVERKYIATAQEPSRPLVWHVFERTN